MNYFSEQSLKFHPLVEIPPPEMIKMVFLIHILDWNCFLPVPRLTPSSSAFVLGIHQYGFVKAQTDIFDSCY